MVTILARSERRVHQSCSTNPRGLAPFVADHPINDLVPTRLICISGLAAEILELWARHLCSETRARELDKWHSGLEQTFTSIYRPLFLSCNRDEAHRERA